MRKAAWALLVCRTAVVGGHIQACPEGHVERVWYNSCRHRLCPQWAWLQVERWLGRQQARLLACEPYHLIFTMPAERHGWWLANVRMTNLLFATVWQTVCELLVIRSIWGPSRASSRRCTPGARRWCCTRMCTVW